MWRKRISSFCPAARFAAPATESAISSIGVSLAVDVPRDLLSVLRESDGVEGDYGLGLIWCAERIVADNLRFRSSTDFQELYMPFDCLVFFADAGNGDQFAYSVTGGAIRRDDVFVWNHETDSRAWVAPNLATYLEWWLTGKIKT